MITTIQRWKNMNLFCSYETHYFHFLVVTETVNNSCSFDSVLFEYMSLHVHT